MPKLIEHSACPYVFESLAGSAGTIYGPIKKQHKKENFTNTKSVQDDFW